VSRNAETRIATVLEPRRLGRVGRAGMPTLSTPNHMPTLAGTKLRSYTRNRPESETGESAIKALHRPADEGSV
jgi:hypothetical protein